MRKLFVPILCTALALTARSDTEIVDGIEWKYSIVNGEAVVGPGNFEAAIPTSTEGPIVVPSVLGGKPVTRLGDYAICGCRKITSVTIPSGVKSIGRYAVSDIYSSIHIVLPESVTEMSSQAIWGNGYIIVCLGQPPQGFPEDNPMWDDGQKVYFPSKYTSMWNALGYAKLKPSVWVVDSRIRENDPTVMDVRYRVLSCNSSVKVRVLAFEDGTRSLAKVVRPETFVDGTGVNVGDNIEPLVEHKISWKVSSDWQTKLAKVKFEVLASEGELLPLKTMTIPASEQYGRMKITTNTITEDQVFDALLWLYADKDSGLTLSGGTLKNGSTVLASGTQISGVNSYYDEHGNYVGYYYWKPKADAPSYVLQKLGYSLLTGAPLTYANQETRLGLSPSMARQYGYKIVE